MSTQPRLKLKDLDVTFNTYSKRSRNTLHWDEFTRLAPRVNSAREVFQLLVDCLVPMGAVNLVYAYQDSNQLVFHSNLEQSWREHYRQCGYQNVDPGILHAWRGGTGPTAMGRGFLRSWKNGFSDSVKRLMPARPWSQATNDLQEDSAEKTGFEIGFMIPLPPQHGMGQAGCSFGSDMRHYEFDKLYNQHGGQIAVVLRTFHDCIQAALQFERKEELKMNKLTIRERNILQMLADGLNKMEISEKISIGRRSVDYALESARDKLGAGQSDILAIRMALNLGWIQ